MLVVGIVGFPFNDIAVKLVLDSGFNSLGRMPFVIIKVDRLPSLFSSVPLGISFLTNLVSVSM